MDNSVYKSNLDDNKKWTWNYVQMIGFFFCWIHKELKIVPDQLKLKI